MEVLRKPVKRRTKGGTRVVEGGSEKRSMRFEVFGVSGGGSGEEGSGGEIGKVQNRVLANLLSEVRTFQVVRYKFRCNRRESHLGRLSLGSARADSGRAVLHCGSKSSLLDVRRFLHVVTRSLKK